MTLDPFQTLEDLIESPQKVIEAWKEKTGRPAVGFVCTYVPEEVLHAAGILPVRLLGGGGDEGSAETLRLPTMSCAFSRRVMEQASRGDLDSVEGIVFPQTCDTIRGLESILCEKLPRLKYFHLHTPVSVDGNAIQLMASELKRLIQWVGDHFHLKVKREALRESIKVYNENRGLLRKLYARRRKGKGGVTTSMVLQAFVAGTVMPKEEHNALLTSLLEQEDGNAASSSGRRRLVISGNLCSSVRLLTSIEEQGVSIVDDDMCTGSRAFADDVAERGDPLWALAHRYLFKVPCPTKIGPEGFREENLTRMVRDSGAEGVIFLLLKFCDPHFFDLPLLEKCLDAEGIPSIVLEHDNDSVLSGQGRTRLEAFLEMIAQP